MSDAGSQTVALPQGGALHSEGSAAEALRSTAWAIGERRSGEAYLPSVSHCALMFVHPRQAFLHYRILAQWIEQAAAARGPAWQHCRLVAKLYDVTDIEFNGFNAHQVLTAALQNICGHVFVNLPKPGRHYVAEVGFELRSGEFVPAARSLFHGAPPEGPSGRREATALYVRPGQPPETLENIWDAQKFLAERARPAPAPGLRIAHASFEAAALGDFGATAAFTSELAAAQAALGHEVRVFVPRHDSLPEARTIAGVLYQPVEVAPEPDPVRRAHGFALALKAQLAALPPFDLVHGHEWMAASAVEPAAHAPVVVSLNSVEFTRLNGALPGELSYRIAAAERASAAHAGLILVPEWLRETAIRELQVPAERVVAFPMEGKLETVWDAPLDPGQVKVRDCGFGPVDRLLVYIGPVDHASGVDLLIDALPTALGRCPNLRVAVIGTGPLSDALNARVWQTGVSHAVRFLGDLRGDPVIRVLRAAEALVLPSRSRVPFDEAVIDLARKAGKAVVTTHAGPAFRVQHEQNGIVTYDNPNSLVWALDRILGDASNTERLGAAGRTAAGPVECSWSGIARRYLSLCAERFAPVSRPSEPHASGEPRP